MESAIKVEHLTKTYKIYESSLQRALAPFRPNETGKRFDALKDISYEFPKGEAIAILGRNGSGKSTLLKIITGVTWKTSGSVEVDGRISAMLELTSGFDQELTGIQNIHLRATAMGIAPAEAEARLDEIVRFADIGEHINQPVRTYSSGMKARLGFAVSVSVDPDILIVDEVLAVGDDIFKIKCVEKMEDFRRQGKTILFVSHNLFTIKAFCTKAIWINEGRLMESGDVGGVVLKYEDFLRRERVRQREARLAAGENVDSLTPLEKSDILQVDDFRMYNDAGKDTDVFDYGEDVLFEFSYTVKRPIDRLTFCYTIRNSETYEVYMADKQNVANIVNSTVGTHTMKVRLKGLKLLGGQFLLSGELWNNDAGFFVGYSNKRPFQIRQTEFLGTGITHVDYDFENE